MGSATTIILLTLLGQAGQCSCNKQDEPENSPNIISSDPRPWALESSFPILENYAEEGDPDEAGSINFFKQLRREEAELTSEAVASTERVLMRKAAYYARQEADEAKSEAAAKQQQAQAAYVALKANLKNNAFASNNISTEYFKAFKAYAIAARKRAVAARNARRAAEMVANYSRYLTLWSNDEAILHFAEQANGAYAEARGEEQAAEKVLREQAAWTARAYDAATRQSKGDMNSMRKKSMGLLATGRVRTQNPMNQAMEHGAKFIGNAGTWMDCRRKAIAGWLEENLSPFEQVFWRSPNSHPETDLFKDDFKGSGAPSSPDAMRLLQGRNIPSSNINAFALFAAFVGNVVALVVFRLCRISLAVNHMNYHLIADN